MPVVKVRYHSSNGTADSGVAMFLLLVLPQNNSRLDLVVFRYAAEHMTRISRIIKQPYGNALLVRVSCLCFACGSR